MPEPQEESEVMDNSEDEDRLYGSASPSSSSTSSEPATRGPNKEKADAAYQEAAEELDAMRVIMAKENSFEAEAREEAVRGEDEALRGVG